MVLSLNTGFQRETFKKNTMYRNYIVIYSRKYSKTLDLWIKCMNGTESTAQKFGLYHY